VIVTAHWRYEDESESSPSYLFSPQLNLVRNVTSELGRRYAKLLYCIACD
jgi:hypothetical protein